MMQLLEMFRAGCYAVGVLASLWLCIEYANRHDRPLAGVFGAQSLLYGVQLLSVAVRYLGMDAAGSRTILTPAVVLHTATLLVLIVRVTREMRATR